MCCLIRQTWIQVQQHSLLNEMRGGNLNLPFNFSSVAKACQCFKMILLITWDYVLHVVIEKCFSQTRQTLSSSLPLWLFQSRVCLFVFPNLSVSYSYSYISIFCFVLFLVEAKIFFPGILRLVSLSLFYCDNSVLLWAIWMLWKIYLSQRYPGAQNSCPRRLKRYRPHT